MNNNLIASIGLLMIVLITSGYILLLQQDEPHPEKENNTNNSLNLLKDETDEEPEKENVTIEHIEFTSETERGTVAVDKGKLDKNAKLSFEVGKKYKYKKTYTEMNRTGITEYVVEKIEKVNGRECYAVSKSEKEILSEEVKNLWRRNLGMSEEELKQREIMAPKQIEYYDKETGKYIQIKRYCLKCEGGDKVIIGMDAEYDTVLHYRGDIFADWMLALNDNFIWEQKINIDGGPYTLNYILKYKVNGRENVNGRECFKVEFKGIDYWPSNRTIWVDIKERIIAKEIVNGLWTNELL